VCVEATHFYLEYSFISQLVAETSQQTQSLRAKHYVKQVRFFALKGSVAVE